MGQIYVEPAAFETYQDDTGVVNSGGHHTGGSAWLYWTAAGFTGNGWFWGTPTSDSDGTYSYVEEGWTNYVNEHGPILPTCNNSHDASKDSFQQHVQEVTTTNLNNILQDWPAKQKYAFILAHSELESSGCVSWNNAD